MWTSYYSNKKIRNENIRLVGISQGVPRWFTGPCFKQLAPSWNLIREADEAVYTSRYYREVLAGLDARKVVEVLKDSALLCWEKPGEFCHRRIVAEWIEKETGVVVPEWGIVSPPPQGTLF